MTKGNLWRYYFMEETVKQVEDLKQRLSEYEQGVGDIQSEVWEPLGLLNNNKEFQQLHKDHIRRNGLTKLEEIRYLLDVIDEIDGARSAEVEKRIDELKRANDGLEHHCLLLKANVKRTSEFLEESEQENSLLIEKLAEAGKSTEDIDRERNRRIEAEAKEKSPTRIIHLSKVINTNSFHK